MALAKANIVTTHLTPSYNSQPANQGAFPAVLDAYRVQVEYDIVDDSDGSVTHNSKSVDLWPLLSGAQQNTLKNITNAVIGAAIARA